MRIKSFQIKNYNSIQDTKVVELSLSNNIVVFAGQNESGKSSILRALRDYEAKQFDVEAFPFTTENKLTPSVSCTYEVESDDNLFELLNDSVIANTSVKAEKSNIVLKEQSINKISNFTITRTVTPEGKTSTEIDDITFNIFKSAILNQVEHEEHAKNEDIQPTPYLHLDDESMDVVTGFFWSLTPSIVFFDDFCDLLPDRIYVSSLETKDTTVKGYRAVKNLETILGIDFVAKNKESDPVRRLKEKSDNDSISIDFQKDWAQRVHNENKVNVQYNFEKRSGVGEEGSYVNFYVETKEGQPLSPKRRSKGLIWFLSLWLELEAHDIEYKYLVLLLDEPDQHLHVKAQKDMLKLIEKFASRGNQIMCATHSPYLLEIEHLNRIKLIINTPQSGTTVENVTTSKIDTKNKKDALQPIADAIGLHLSEFSPLKNKNVLLEGISDFYYFSAMKQILNINGDYGLIPGIGVRKINTLISLCIGYGLNWVVVIDDDPKKGGKDSINKFTDIKDFVFDGKEESAKKKIYILDQKVGIENMFTTTDLKLIDSTISNKEDKVSAVGKNRKVLFAKGFLEKVEKGDITEAKLSKTAKDNFKKAFEFIDNNLL